MGRSFLKKQWAILFAALTAVLAAASCAATPDKPTAPPTESVWLRPVEGPVAFDGFYLAADGRLLLINIFSMTGDRWAWEKDTLTLWTHTERYPKPMPVKYRIKRDGATLSLRGPSGSSAGSYEAASEAARLSGARWRPVFLLNPQGFNPPTGPPVFIQFDPDPPRAHGFGGVNQFQGSYRTDGIAIKIGPLGATMMSGPGLDYEMLFFSVLSRSDTFLIARGMLFLYQGAEITAAFRADSR